MKNLKTIIIIILALAVAVGAYFIIDDIISKTKTINPNVTEFVVPFNVKSADISRYAFSVSGEQTVVELMQVNVKDEDGKDVTTMQYRLVNEPTRELNDKIKTALVQAATLVCVNVVEENPKDISKYGIDYDSYFEVGLIDGTSYKVYFGDVIPVTYNVYVMREGVDKIYTISDLSFAMLSIYREYLLSEVIFPGTPDNLTAFSLYKKSELEFTLVPDQYIKWKATAPLESKVYPSTAQDMIDNTYNMVIGEYVNVLPTKADYVNYDLYKPAYSVKVTAENKSVLLHIGRLAIEENSFYAKFDNSDEVFLIAKKYLGWVDTELMEILITTPYEPSIKGIKFINYIFDSGEIFEIDIQEKDYIFDDKPVKNYEYTINGEVVQLQFGATVYNTTFYGTAIVDVDNDWQGPAENQKPYLLLKLGYTSGNEQNIAYYKRNDTTMYYVRYNPDLDMMTQYLGVVVDSGPIEGAVKQLLVQYSNNLYIACTDGKEHSFGEWIIVREATEEQKGLKEKTCSVCGHKISAPIAIIRHTDPGTYESSSWWIILVAVVIVGGIGTFLIAKKTKNKKEKEKNKEY